MTKQGQQQQAAGTLHDCFTALRRSWRSIIWLTRAKPGPSSMNVSTFALSSARRAVAAAASMVKSGSGRQQMQHGHHEQGSTPPRGPSSGVSIMRIASPSIAELVSRTQNERVG